MYLNSLCSEISFSTSLERKVAVGHTRTSSRLWVSMPDFALKCREHTVHHFTQVWVCNGIDSWRQKWWLLVRNMQNVEPISEAHDETQICWNSVTKFSPCFLTSFLIPLTEDYLASPWRNHPLVLCGKAQGPRVSTEQERRHSLANQITTSAQKYGRCFC